MITEIGIIAGEIWQYLDKHQSATLSELVQGLKQPQHTILMSLGWLAREGHVNLSNESGDFVVQLTLRT